MKLKLVFFCDAQDESLINQTLLLLSSISTINEGCGIKNSVKHNDYEIVVLPPAPNTNAELRKAICSRRTFSYSSLTLSDINEYIKHWVKEEEVNDKKENSDIVNIYFNWCCGHKESIDRACAADVSEALESVYNVPFVGNPSKLLKYDVEDVRMLMQYSGVPVNNYALIKSLSDLIPNTSENSESSNNACNKRNVIKGLRFPLLIKSTFAGNQTKYIGIALNYEHLCDFTKNGLYESNVLLVTESHLQQDHNNEKISYFNLHVNVISPENVIFSIEQIKSLTENDEEFNNKGIFLDNKNNNNNLQKNLDNLISFVEERLKSFANKIAKIIIGTKGHAICTFEVIYDNKSRSSSDGGRNNDDKDIKMNLIDVNFNNCSEIIRLITSKKFNTTSPLSSFVLDKTSEIGSKMTQNVVETSVGKILNGENGFNSINRWVRMVIPAELQRFVRRSLPLHVVSFDNESKGYHLRASRDIKQGEVVFEDEGRAFAIVTRQHIEKHWNEEDKTLFSEYAWPLDSDGHVYAIWEENPKRWRPINHSCGPNLYFGEGHSLNVIAANDIANGEDLTLDYATFCDETMKPFQCHCGKKLCRGLITPSHKNEEILLKYGTHSWHRKLPPKI